MRFRTLLLALGFVLTSFAHTYVEGANLGDSTLTMAVYHIQVDLDKRHGGKLEMFWNRTDSANSYRAELEVPPWLQMDPNHSTQLKTRVYRRTDGRDSLLAEHRFATTVPRSVSLRLKVHDGRAYLHAGSFLGRDPIPVPFDTEHPGAFGASCSDFLNGTRHTLVYSFKSKPPAYSGMDRSSIIRHLEDSADPVEGLWQYLDRDIPTKGVRLHHKYTLACISDGDGGYLLLDLSAPEGPIPLKGRLSPTIFHHNYNLVWYPADGPVQDDDCYADISMEGHLLTIHIPVLKTSFRLSRAPQRK